MRPFSPRSWWTVAAAATASACTASLLTMVAVMPVEEPQVIPGRVLELPGLENPQIVALAVVPEGSPRGARALSVLLDSLHVYGIVAGDAHMRDADAAESRYLAQYAALHIQGSDPDEWEVVSDDGDGALRVECPSDETQPCVPGRAARFSPRSNDTWDVSESLDREQLTSLAPGRWRPASLPSVPVASPSLYDWVGGSAGLAYALSYLDRDTDGNLVPAGMRVAATGALAVKPYQPTLVLPVSGVEQKVEGAAIAGATVMFVPNGQAPSNPPIRVVEVETVEEAVSWLCRNGGTASIC